MRHLLTTKELLDIVPVPRVVLEDLLTDFKAGRVSEIEDMLRWFLEADHDDALEAA